MWSFILKRLAQGVITVWFIATATFFAMHNVPGDPLLNDRAMTAAIRANVEAKYGLDTGRRTVCHLSGQSHSR